MFPPIVKLVASIAFLAILSHFLNGCLAHCNQGVPFAGNIPPRPLVAKSGSEVFAKIRTLERNRREQTVLNEALAGNTPPFSRCLLPVLLNMKKGRQFFSATIWVTPDYFSLGSDSNFLRMPMTPITAQRIADRYGFLLPTKKLVNEIYRQAKTKLTPQPLPPGPQMVSANYISRHNQMIEKQRLGKRAPLGTLTTGHKKDIVITNRLGAIPRRVAIYGWHRKIGAPIQPLSLVHGIDYADYSHGVRLISSMMIVNGKTMPVSKVMSDPNLWPLVSDEGPIRNTSVHRMRLVLGN